MRLRWNQRCLFLGLALLLAIISINLVADQLRDVLNPKLKQ